MFKAKTWRQRSKKERKALLEISARTKSEIRRIKKSPCADCGNSFNPESMDFDHVRGTKLKNISQISVLSLALEEIKKCELVCSNCHRVRTRKRAIEASSKKAMQRDRIYSLCKSFMLENDENKADSLPIWYIDRPSST